MLRTAVRTVAGGLLAAALIATSAPSAQAATQTKVQLPFTTFGDVVATNTRVFVSGGLASTSVVVTRPNGQLASVIRELPGPSDLELSPDGRLLYVALRNGISVYDARTLSKRAHYPTGDICPSSIALSNRRMYFGYSCVRGQWEGQVGVLDLTRPGDSPQLGLLPETTYDAPLVAAAVGAPELLLVTDPGVGPGQLWAFTTTSNGGLTGGRSVGHGVLGNPVDIAMTKDGSTFFTASGWPYEILQFATDDITLPSGTFPTGPYPNAVALSPNESVIAVGLFAWYDPDIRLFSRDGVPGGVFELGDDMRFSGLAWSPSSDRLYAVTGDHANERPSFLHILDLRQ